MRWAGLSRSSGQEPEPAARVELHAVVAVGHQGNAADLPEMLQAREVPSDRVRSAQSSDMAALFE